MSAREAGGSFSAMFLLSLMEVKRDPGKICDAARALGIRLPTFQRNWFDHMTLFR